MSVVFGQSVSFLSVMSVEFGQCVTFLFVTYVEIGQSFTFMSVMSLSLEKCQFSVFKSPTRDIRLKATTMNGATAAFAAEDE